MYVKQLFFIKKKKNLKEEERIISILKQGLVDFFRAEIYDQYSPQQRRIFFRKGCKWRDRDSFVLSALYGSRFSQLYRVVLFGWVIKLSTKMATLEVVVKERSWFSWFWRWIIIYNWFFLKTWNQDVIYSLVTLHSNIWLLFANFGNYFLCFMCFAFAFCNFEAFLSGCDATPNGNFFPTF